MSSQSNQCERCGERYTDSYTEWCKSCHINYFKNNFTNWTSENEKIDIFIQGMQLKICDYYYSGKVVEWVPYNQFRDIIKIRNDDDNVPIMYLAIWNNGPLIYDNDKKEWIRKSNKRVTLKYLTLDINEFLLNEAEYYSKNNNNKIYGISQNPNTKDYIIVCQDEYCVKCGKKYVIWNESRCIPCEVNYFKDNFINWTSGSKEVDILIQKVQLKLGHYMHDRSILEWIPYNQLIDIKEIGNDKDNFITISSAIWNNGPLIYNNDERKWIRKSNEKVTLKRLALDEFLNEAEDCSINTINKGKALYGISQDPNTKDYITVFKNKYCEKCGNEHTKGFYNWCNSCEINYLKVNFINWTSVSKEIDNFIQEMQLKYTYYTRDIIVEWIPFNQLINVKEMGNDNDDITTIYSAIWNDGPLVYDYNDEKKWKRESNKKVTLKCLAIDINEFLNKAKNYSINKNTIHINGISQNPNTKDYIIVCQGEYCYKCDKRYTELWFGWCKSCYINYNFTNWTSGNKEIDIFIQEMQLKFDRSKNDLVEWISFNQLTNVKEIRNDNNDVTIYSAIWINGPLNDNHSNGNWMRRESNKNVTLITFNYLDSNIHNMNDELLNMAKNYSIKKYDTNKIYGISQNPNTKNYILVLRDQYCKNCNKEYTDKYYYWCKSCDRNNLKGNLANWTSGNEKIDNFIQEMQLKIDSGRDKAVEWIPYDQFEYIKEIGKGGFSTVYSAIWKDGPLTYNYSKRYYIRECYKEVALKCLDNSQNITEEYLNEAKAYAIKDNWNGYIRIYGISQNPDTKSYIMVLQYAKCGNFSNWIYSNYRNISYDTKLHLLKMIINSLKEIHKKKMVHRDFHIGNILINEGQLSDKTNGHYTFFRPTAYVSDIGLCGEASNTDKTNIYGVMPYVAPEVLRGKPYTQAADIYSFGMIMYFVLTGRQPFDNHAHDQELALNICNGIRPEIPIIPELKSNWYIDLMKKCWDSNPDNRPNVESISTILNGKERYDKKFKEAVRYLSKEYEEIKQLTTHPQAFYTSRLLNPYTQQLTIDFIELNAGR